MEKKLKLVVVTAFGVLPISAGGTSIQSKEFCQTFFEHGQNVILIVPTSDTKFRYDFYSKVIPMKFTNIAGLKQFSMSAFTLVKSLVHDPFKGADAVVLYGMNFGIASAVLRSKVPILMRIPDVDFELSGVGISSQEKVRRILVRSYYSLVLKKTSALIFPSKFSNNVFNRFFKHQVKYQCVIPNFISSIFMQNSADPFSKTGFISLIYVGALSKRKGVHLLVDAYIRLTKEYNNLELILLGDGPLREKLEELSASNNQLRMKLFGNVPLSEVSKRMQKADIFILPSYIEGQSNSLLQGLSSGLAVVASDIEANRELISNGFNGFLFEKGNKDDLYLRLKEIINQPEIGVKMAMLARTAASVKNGRERVYRLWSTVLSEVTK